jgi:hypothetical protein
MSYSIYFIVCLISQFILFLM